MSKQAKRECPIRKTSIGGQALMEGIMMRGPEKCAMAVRRQNGEIVFEQEGIQKKKRPAFTRWPIIRGVFGFIDSMVMGYKYLMRSAEIAMEDMDVEAKGDEPSVSPSDEEKVQKEETVQEIATASEVQEKPKGAFTKGAMAAIMTIATVLGVGLAIGLFVWLPSFLYSLLEDHVLPRSLARNRYLRSVFEGLLKIAILVAYMALVSLMKDIRRTFMYHGAEHKTIFCYENGLPLTVENVRLQRRFHPRCGTSFLILMLIVSIVIGLVIPIDIRGINDIAYTFIRAFIKLLLIPLTMGVGYELLKLAGRHDNLFTRIISAPGMWLQRITVLEPTDDMIECAIKAFVAVMPEGESTTE